MKRLLLVAALVPAMAFAQQATTPAQQQALLNALKETSKPESGMFPASCEAPMAKIQMSQAIQKYVGNPMGDTLNGLTMGQQAGEITENGYSCMVTANWRDHGSQHGLLSLIKAGNGVIVNWHPFGY